MWKVRGAGRGEDSRSEPVRSETPEAWLGGASGGAGPGQPRTPQGTPRPAPPLAPPSHASGAPPDRPRPGVLACPAPMTNFPHAQVSLV